MISRRSIVSGGLASTLTNLFIILLFNFNSNVMGNEVKCRNLLNVDFSKILDAPTKITGTKYTPKSKDLPAFCDVIGYSAPQVGLQLRLPDDWDGRFHMEGCGTLCGVRIIENADDVLNSGTAISTTDMGHSAPLSLKGWNKDSPDYNIVMRSGLWAYNNINQEIDYAYRGTHKAVLASKAIIQEYYNSEIDFSYFRGCSTGGRQGLLMAQRYPWHFDGIISGAPAGINPDYINIFWRTLVNLDSENRVILSHSKVDFLHKTVMEQCDGLDGLKDNVLSDPWACKPNFQQLQCYQEKKENCFSQDEVEVINKLYEGAFLSNEQRVSWGVPKGGELGLKRYILNESGELGKFEPLALDRLRYTWFDYDPGPSYNVLDFNLDRDVPRLFTKGFLQAPNNPDLTRYHLNNGKILIYQGLNDMLNTEPLIQYVEKVKKIISDEEDINNFLRLYLVPGMNHCRGGPGVDQFNWVEVVRNWVENKVLPDVITGYKYSRSKKSFNGLDPKFIDNIIMKRPIYNYPYTAHYKGGGGQNNLNSFSPKPLSF